MHYRLRQKLERAFFNFFYINACILRFHDFMIFCRLFDMNTPRVKDLPDEDSLSLYAVLNVWEPPRRLLSRSTK